MMIKHLIITGFMMAATLVNSQQIIEHDTGYVNDLHGCIGSAGYTWCHTTESCVREWETPCLDEPCPMHLCDLTCPNGYIINDEGCSECLCVLEDYPDNCIYWFDGCNTCSVSNGITVMCTVLKCITTGIPMCLLYSVTHE
jgi:hypothetical protein